MSYSNKGKITLEGREAHSFLPWKRSQAGRWRVDRGLGVPGSLSARNGRRSPFCFVFFLLCGVQGSSSSRQTLRQVPSLSQGFSCNKHQDQPSGPSDPVTRKSGKTGSCLLNQTKRKGALLPISRSRLAQRTSDLFLSRRCCPLPASENHGRIS